MSFKKNHIGKLLRREAAKHAVLLISLAFSGLLLIIFLLFQFFDLEILQLDTKWIILSGIPVLLGLFIGGYIKTFKGFGLELESNLEEPVPLKIVTAKNIEVMEVPQMQKLSLELVKQMHESERSKITRLRFVNGRTGFYDPYATERYLALLINLRFIEVTDESNKFLYLMPARQLKTPENIEDFINYVVGGNFENTNHSLKPFTIITDHLSSTQTLIEAYRTIKKSPQAGIFNNPALPILDEKNEMMGIVEIQSLEKQIAYEVDKALP